MIDAATALKEMFSETAPEMSNVETKAKKKEAPAQEAEVKKYSFQEVRGIMASLAGKGCLLYTSIQGVKGFCKYLYFFRFIQDSPVMLYSSITLSNGNYPAFTIFAAVPIITASYGRNTFPSLSSS